MSQAAAHLGLFPSVRPDPEPDAGSAHAAALLRELGLDGRGRPLNEVYVPGLDPGIERAVLILRAAGIETYESCEGGPGHSYPEPAVRFGGDKSEGFKALDVALKHGLPVSSLRRHWAVIDLEPVGPEWELVFYRTLEPICSPR